jgi:hypothetical protein
LTVLLFSTNGLTEAKIRKSLFREGKLRGIIIIIFAPDFVMNCLNEQRRKPFE